MLKPCICLLISYLCGMKTKKPGLTPIEDLITEDFGPVGTLERDLFDIECNIFIIGERLNQEALANKIGTKKSFISRVEKGRADIQISTLVKLFSGLGRQISIRLL